MKRTTVLAFLTAALISMGSACAHAQAPPCALIRELPSTRGQAASTMHPISFA